MSKYVNYVFGSECYIEVANNYYAQIRIFGDIVRRGGTKSSSGLETSSKHTNIENMYLKKIENTSVISKIFFFCNFMFLNSGFSNAWKME